MALRSLIAFAVVIAIQALAGCGMPAKSSVAREDRSAWQKAEIEARKQFEVRRQVEAGTLGLAQLFPGGAPIEARHLPPLPRPSAVPIPVVPVRVAQSSTSETRLQVAFGATARQPDGCVFKPVMSDADIEACR
jgi:regulation of enolase protein 1 (concanavalin A-like superfamily)